MPLSTKTFLDLRELIYEHSGMFFSESKTYLLESRLLPRLQERNCASFEEYYSLLKFGAWREKELSAMISLVVTTETFFYRDQAQLQAFTGTIVPLMMQANQRLPQLRQRLPRTISTSRGEEGSGTRSKVGPRSKD